MLSTTYGGHLIARALQAEDVEVIFSLCATRTNPIYDGCLSCGIRIVDGRHDTASAMSADGYARVSGKAGVALVTSGPGFLYALPALGAAHTINSPLVLLAGYTEAANIDRMSFQEIDQVALARPITRWSGLAIHAHRLHEYVQAAFRNALAAQQGPVVLSLPTELQTAGVALVADSEFGARGEGQLHG